MCPSSHYPVKAAEVNGPFSKAYRSTPYYGQVNKPLFLAFPPLLLNNVAFKRRNSLRFCLLNREGPRGTDSEHRVGADSSSTAPADSSGVEGHGRQSPRPSPTAETGRQCHFGSHGLESQRNYRILLSHTTWPLPFSIFSMVPTSLPMSHK